MNNFLRRRNVLIQHRNKFKVLEHSEGIATLPSLIVLDGVLATYKIQKVLEIGRGLGTLTKFMGMNYELDLYSIESDSYCIKQSARNCDPVKYIHHEHVSELPSEILRAIDLVVIDGPISRSEMKLILQGSNPRIFFFENHQLVSKVRICLNLILKGRFVRYVEVFPFHNFEGPSYIVSLPIHSYLTYLSNNFAILILLLPRATKHIVIKLSKLENPFDDSYHFSKWNPNRARK